MTIFDLLERCFKRLQTLSILPTKGNMEILLQTLYDIQEANRMLKEEEANGGHDGPEADPAGRNDH